MLLNEELFDAAIEVPVSFPQLGTSNKITFNPMKEVPSFEDELDDDYFEDGDDEIIVSSPSSITDSQQDKLATSATLTELLSQTFANI